MERRLLCGIMLLLCSGVFAQTVTIRQTASGTKFSSDQIPKAAVPDSLKQLTATPAIPADSIRQLTQLPAGVQRIYSEKQWQTYADSLVKIPGVTLPPMPEIPALKNVSEQEMVDAVNQKFFPSATPQLPVSASQADALQQLDKPDYKTLVPAASVTDLSALGLSDLSRQNLAPLSGNIIKSKYLTALDSVRKINLREEKLMLDEKTTAAEQTVARIRQRPNFLDRSYLEGVVGFSGGAFKILQIAPALGYHVTDNLSFGLGPNILVNTEGKRAYTTIGAKTFMKTEFLNRQAYIQVEDIMDNAGTAGTAEKRKSILQQHRVYAGAGYLLTLSAPVTLNFSVLYQLTDNTNNMNDFSPWVIRVGISSIKLKR